MNCEYELAFTAINDYFDHIYVLTLERAQERHEHIRESLQGLNWSFHYGTDVQNLNQETLISDGIYDDAAHRRTKRTHRSMTVGEVACALSHRSMHQDIVDNGYRRALILEDDAIPIYENLHLFSEQVEELPDNWDLLMLGYYDEKVPSVKHEIQRHIYAAYHHLNLFNWQNVDRQFIRTLCMSPYRNYLYALGKVLGAHAYALSRSAAEKFIDYQTPVILQADRIFNYFKAAHDLNGFALRDKLFIPSEFSKISYIGYGKDATSVAQ